MEFIAALATDDGKTFVDRHFGDARFYHLYTVGRDGADFLKVVPNTAPEETGHADPRKAGGIARLLKTENVNVLATRIFGPNLKRVRKKFVCVILDCHAFSEGLDFLSANIDTIAAAWEQGEEREYLNQKTMT